ncbi:hypothetical protein CHUAL_000457 [Chamberlinius hualienensis]
MVASTVNGCCYGGCASSTIRGKTSSPQSGSVTTPNSHPPSLHTITSECNNVKRRKVTNGMWKSTNTNLSFHTPSNSSPWRQKRTFTNCRNGHHYHHRQPIQAAEAAPSAASVCTLFEGMRSLLAVDTGTTTAAAVIYVLPAIVSILCYINSLSGDFVHDDIMAVTTNQDVVGKTTLANVFQNDFWGKPMHDNTSHKSYRPLTIITFR